MVGERIGGWLSVSILTEYLCFYTVFNTCLFIIFLLLKSGVMFYDIVSHLNYKCIEKWVAYSVKKSNCR